MRRIFLLCLAALLIVSGCSESSDPTRSNDFVPLTAIKISSQYPQIANLTENQFSATGEFSGVFTRDITTEVVWSSSDEGVLVISNEANAQGLATAVSPGTVTVTATSNDISDSFDFEVTDAVLNPGGLSIAPLMPSVNAGLTRQFSASGTFDDGTTQDLTRVAVWSSSDEGIATVSNLEGSEGLASGVSEGTATIAATFGGETASTELTVTAAAFASLAVTPADLERPRGLTIQYTATVTFTDGSTEDVTELSSWESSIASVASVSNTAGSSGEVETLAVGITEITATYQGEEASADLEVNNETLDTLELFPEDPTILIGQNQAFTALGTYTGGMELDLTDQVTWESSDIDIATISNDESSEGVARGLDDGVVDITATFDGVTETTTLTVD